MLADFVIVGIDSVACVAEVSAEFLPVGGVYDGRKAVVWVFELFHRRHVADCPVVHHYKEYCHGGYSEHKKEPKQFYNRALPLGEVIVV